MIRRILTALTALGFSAAVAGVLAAPSLAAPPGVEVAFNGGTHSCNLESWIGPADEGGGSLGNAICSDIAPDSSPSQVILANGTQVVAFQGLNGNLWTFRENPGTDGSQHNQNVPMMPDTSPSIAVYGSETAIAFQGSNGHLWTSVGSGGSVGTAVDTGLGMAAFSSPSIGVLTDSSGDQYMVVAFQANTGILWTYGALPGKFSGSFNTGLGMASGTSPSLTVAGGIAQVAFQANTGILWTWHGNGAIDTGGVLNTGLAMGAGTSPSITAGINGSFSDVAFQDNHGDLQLYSETSDFQFSGFSNFGADFPMAAGSSPSITALDTGQPAVAYRTNTGLLSTVLGTANNINQAGGSTASSCTQQFCAVPVASYTSPSIVAAIPPPEGLSLTAKGTS